MCTRPRLLRSALARQGLDVGVEARAEDRDRGPDGRARRQRRTEGEDTETDDEDPLAQVPHRVRHHVQLGEELEGDGVVGVVGQPRGGEEPGQQGALAGQDRPRAAREQRRAVGDGGDGQSEDQRQQGVHGIDVQRRHALPARHEPLREDAPAREGDGGPQRREETHPSEGQLAGTGERDPEHDGEQRQDLRPGQHGSRDQEVPQRHPDRLAGLHDVREGDGSPGEGDGGQAVAHRVADGRGQEPPQKTSPHGLEGVLDQAADPTDRRTRDDRGELHHRHGPRMREEAQSLLVDNIE
mmetsp:Transcript_51761/g.160586  ORF Transcript_51761/g.160586 Transcript_51761/m.160586 type:complete len:297 (-) Transcript_51761:594-1484(-)